MSLCEPLGERIGSVEAIGSFTDRDAADIVLFGITIAFEQRRADLGIVGACGVVTGEFVGVVGFAGVDFGPDEDVTTGISGEAAGLAGRVEGADQGAGGVELLNPGFFFTDHVDVAGAIDGNGFDRPGARKVDLADVGSFGG